MHGEVYSWKYLGSWNLVRHLRHAGCWLTIQDTSLVGLYFLNIFIKYKYLHLFSARRLQCQKLPKTIAHPTTILIHSLEQTLRFTLSASNSLFAIQQLTHNNWHTWHAHDMHMTHINTHACTPTFQPIFIVAKQKLTFSLSQISLA
jgi:hypothetical protein